MTTLQDHRLVVLCCILYILEMEIKLVLTLDNNGGQYSITDA